MGKHLEPPVAVQRKRKGVGGGGGGGGGWPQVQQDTRVLGVF